MQSPGSATLTKPCLLGNVGGRLTRFRLSHLLVLRRFGEGGLTSLVLSYWERSFK